MELLNAIKFLAKKYLLPTFIILGNFIAIFYTGCVVMSDNNNVWLTLLEVAGTIAFFFVATYFGNFICSGGLKSVMAAEPDLELVLKKDGRIEIKQKENVNLFVAAIFGLFLSFFGIPLFLIGFIRALCSLNIRKLYANATAKILDGDEENKKKIKIMLIICFSIIFVMLAVSVLVHISKGINILNLFDPNRKRQ